MTESNFSPRRQTSTDKIPLIMLLVLLGGILLLDKVFVFGMNWVDYTIIGVVFFCAFIGYIKGLISAVFSLVGYIVAVVCAVLFSEPVAILIMNRTNIGEAVANSLEGLYSGITLPAFNQSLDLTGIQNNHQFIENHPELKQFFSENMMFHQLFDNINPFASGSGAISNAVSSITDVLVFSILKVIAVMVIFFVVKLAVLIIGRLVNTVISQSNFLKTTNKTIGLALGAVIGCLIVFIAVTYVIPLVDSMNIVKMPDEYRYSVVLSWLLPSSPPV